MKFHVLHYFRTSSLFKDVRGWQFLTMKAAETLCIVCLPPEKYISWKKYLGNRLSKNSHFIRGFDLQICILTNILKTVK